MIIPAYVAVEALDAAREIPVGETFEVTARVGNAGDVPADGEIRYLVDNEVVEATEVTLAPGEGRTVAFAHSVPEPGTYLQRIETPHASNGLALMVVDETDEEEPAGSDGREPADARDDNGTADDDGGTAGTADGATADESPGDTSAIPGFGVGAALAGVTAAASILNRRLRGDN